MSQSSSESDIWDYKSLKKTKRRDKQPQSCDNAAKRRRVNQQESSKEKANQNINEKRVGKRNPNVKFNTITKPSTRNQLPSGANESLINSCDPVSSESNEILDSSKDCTTGGHCPVCQMPFSILVVQSQRWHVAECLDTPGETNKGMPLHTVEVFSVQTTNTKRTLNSDVEI